MENKTSWGAYTHLYKRFKNAESKGKKCPFKNECRVGKNDCVFKDICKWDKNL